MRSAWLVVLIGVVSCGKVEAEEYLVDFTEQYCDVWLACTDPAQLAFDGLDSPESCVATNGPRFADQWNGCVLDQKNADRCLAFLPGTDCPESGEDLDAAIPAECYGAWKKCIGGGTPVVPADGT
jgi:hypothetical protein